MLDLLGLCSGSYKFLGIHGLLGECGVVTAGPPDERQSLRIGVNKRSVLCENIWRHTT